MTTIAFDGKTLVGDTRRTWGGDLIDNASKLVRVKDTLYKGENVLALAGAGKSSLIGKLQQLFVDDPSRFESHFRMARKAGIMSKEASCQLLIVTDKDVYTLNTIDLGKGKILTPYNKDHTFYELMEQGENPLCILGSGMHHVETLHRLFSMPLELALAAACLVPSAVSGGIINVFRFEDRQVVKKEFIVHRDAEELYEKVQAYMHSPECKWLGKEPPSIHFEELVSKKKVEKPEVEPV